MQPQNVTGYAAVLLIMTVEASNLQVWLWLQPQGSE